MNNFLKLTVTFLLAFFTFNIFFSSLKDHRRWENIFIDIQQKEKTEGRKKIPVKENDEERNDEEDSDGLSIAIGTFLLAIPLFLLLRYPAHSVLEYILRNGFIELEGYDEEDDRKGKEELLEIKKFYNDESCRQYVDEKVLKVFKDVYFNVSNSVDVPDNVDLAFLFGLIFLSLNLSLAIVFCAFNFYKKRLSLRKNKHSRKFKFWKIVLLVIAIVIFVVFFVIWFIYYRNKTDVNYVYCGMPFPFFRDNFDKKKYIDVSDINAIRLKRFVEFNYAYAKMKKIFEETIGDDFDYFYQKHFERHKELVNLLEKRIKKEEKEITNLDQLIKRNCKRKRLEKRLNLERNKKELEFLLQGCKAEKKKIEEEIRNVYKKTEFSVSIKNAEKADKMLKDLFLDLNHDCNIDKNEKEAKKKREDYLNLLYSYEYVQKGIELAEMGIDIFTEDLSDIDNEEDDEYSYFEQDLDSFLGTLRDNRILLAEFYPTTDNNPPHPKNPDYLLEKQKEIGSYFDEDKNGDFRKKLILLSVRIQSLQEEKEMLCDFFDKKFFSNNHSMPSCVTSIERYYGTLRARKERSALREGDLDQDLTNAVGKDKVKRYFEIKKEILKNKIEYLKKFDDFLEHLKQNRLFEIRDNRQFNNFSLVIEQEEKRLQGISDKIEGEKGNEYKKSVFPINENISEEEKKNLEELSDEAAARIVGQKQNYDLLNEAIDNNNDLFEFRKNFYLVEVEKNNKANINFPENKILGSEILFERIAKVLLAKERIEKNKEFYSDISLIENLRTCQNNDQIMNFWRNKTLKKNNKEQMELKKSTELFPKDFENDKISSPKFSSCFQSNYLKYEKEITDLDRDLSFLNRRIRTALAYSEDQTSELLKAYQEKKKIEEAATPFWQPKGDQNETGDKIYKAYKYLKKGFSPEVEDYYYKQQSLSTYQRDELLENIPMERDPNYYQQVADSYYILREQAYNYKERHPEQNNNNSYDKLLELLKRKNKTKERLAKRKSIRKIKKYISNLETKNGNLTQEFPHIAEMFKFTEGDCLPSIFVNNGSDRIEEQKLKNKHSQLLEETALQWRTNLREIDKELKEKKDLFKYYLQEIKKIDKKHSAKKAKKNEINNNLLDNENNENINEKNYVENIADRFFLSGNQELLEKFFKDSEVQDYSKTVDEIGRLQEKRKKLLTYQLADTAQEIKDIRNSFEEDNTDDNSLYVEMKKNFFLNQNNKNKVPVSTNELVRNSRKKKANDSEYLDIDTLPLCFPEELEDRYFLMINEFYIAQQLLGIPSIENKNISNKNNKEKVNKILESLPLKEKERKWKRKKKLKTISYPNSYPNGNMETVSNNDLERMFIKEEEKKIVRDYQQSSKKLKDIQENICYAIEELSSWQNAEKNVGELEEEVDIGFTKINIIDEELKKLKEDFDVEDKEEISIKESEENNIING